MLWFETLLWERGMIHDALRSGIMDAGLTLFDMHRTAFPNAREFKPFLDDGYGIDRGLADVKRDLE